MSTVYHYKSESRDANRKTDASQMRFAIVTSEWNRKITQALYDGAKNTLLKQGAKEENIFSVWVPGSFELIYAAARHVKQRKADAVIVLGSVIRGETPHFDYICSGVTQGIALLNTEGEIPVIFGLLTTEDMAQAEERAGGRLGNKGEECALDAVEMVAFSQPL